MASRRDSEMDAGGGERLGWFELGRLQCLPASVRNNSSRFRSNFPPCNEEGLQDGHPVFKMFRLQSQTTVLVAANLKLEAPAPAHALEA